MTPPLWKLSFVIFPAIAILHLYVSPYTKVEESFNIQAVHDILEYGIPLSEAAQKLKVYYDHMTFPGAVPRTFVGSIILSGLAKPEIWYGELVGKAAQLHVRAVLGGMNATALAVFARAIYRAYGPIVSGWYVVLQASQFHLWYYASRTLPNMFAFFFSTLALALLLPSPSSSLGQQRRWKIALYLLTLSTVIFRSELALLLGAHSLWLLRQAKTLEAVKTLFRKVYLPAIVPGFLLAVGLTVVIDSYLWQSPKLIWPELSAFLSNVFPSEGQQGASAWGTQPFYWYLGVALPRLLMAQMAMVDFLFLRVTTWQDDRVTDNLFPSYIYMAIYSILPHKETRFMFPIVPSLTLVAALTCTRLTINAHKSATTKSLLYAAVCGTALMAFVSHAVLLPLSTTNYPGGEALAVLHEYYSENWQQVSLRSKEPKVHVHLTNLALQSGVTRFLEQPVVVEDIKKASVLVTKSDASYAETRAPLILPGDVDHPPLTVTFQPQASGSASVTPKHPCADPLWVYDKTENNTKFLEPMFWEQFDFVVVEDPQLAIGAWDVVEEIRSLGRPYLSADDEQSCPRFVGWSLPLSELVQRWFVADEADLERGGTTALLHAMYAGPVAGTLSHIHNIAHDVARCGYGMPRNLIPFWPEIGLETRLYVLQRSGSGTKPNRRPRARTSTLPALPQRPATQQDPMDFEKMGPLVVNKDGTLSRLDNWAQMNQQERKKTVEYLKKRNLIRLEAAVV